MTPKLSTPELRLSGGAESSLTPADVLENVVDHLQAAPPAWDPYATT